MSEVFIRVGNSTEGYVCVRVDVVVLACPCSEEEELRYVDADGRLDY